MFPASPEGWDKTVARRKAETASWRATLRAASSAAGAPAGKAQDQARQVRRPHAPAAPRPPARRAVCGRRRGGGRRACRQGIARGGRLPGLGAWRGGAVRGADHQAPANVAARPVQRWSDCSMKRGPMRFIPADSINPGQKGWKHRSGT